MNLKEKINQNLKQSLKERKELETSTLRMLNAAILNREKTKRYKLSQEKKGLKEEELEKGSRLQDEEVIEVISSEIKKRKEAVLEFEKADRDELAKKEKKEMEILKKYLPEQLTENEIKKLATEAIKETKAENSRDMGKVMGVLMPRVKGKADGSLVSKTVKELLGS